MFESIDKLESDPILIFGGSQKERAEKSMHSFSPAFILSAEYHPPKNSFAASAVFIASLQ